MQMTYRKLVDEAGGNLMIKSTHKPYKARWIE